MKKWTIISMLCVVILYVLGLILHFNMRLLLFIAFIIAGLFVYLDPSERPYRTANWRNNTYIDVQTHEIETEGGSFKSTPLSSPFVGVIIAIILCFAHNILFINKNEVSITYNPNYYAEYISGNNSVRIYIDQQSKDIVTSLVIINTQKELQDNQPLNIYSDALIYKDTLPITYNVATYSETIVLNLYMKEFDFKDAKEMFNYIGLENECHDSNLTFSEIKNSQSFKYKDVITNGEYKEIFYSKLELHDTGIKCN